MDVSMERLEVKRTPGHGLLEVQLSKPEQERSGDLYHTNGGGWVPYRLEERYVLQRKVGQGAYGVVCLKNNYQSFLVSTHFQLDTPPSLLGNQLGRTRR
jgi:hypothetical protein